MVEPTLTQGTWANVPATDLNAAVSSAFGASVAASYTINSIEVGDLENTINAGSPYPNMDAYFADVSITQGPGTQLPEVPQTVMLPGAALLILGGGYLVLRRRRSTSPAAG